MPAKAATQFACEYSNFVVCKLEWIMADQSAAATLIGAVVTGAGLFFAGWQIYANRRQHQEELRWRRSEFVRTLLSEMIDNPNIALITRILDWRSGPARIPEPFRPLFVAMRASGRNPAWDRSHAADEYFEINWDRFVRALKVMRDLEWREPDMYMYRTCFDSFCTFIQGVAEDVRTIGVEPVEYADLSFYCHRVIFPRNAGRELDIEADTMLERYIKEYYNDKTYKVIVAQAQVYADTHEDEMNPAEKESLATD